MNDLLLIRQKIYEIRNQRVMLDFELAELYGVETSQLKRAVRRNIERFDGEDFMIVLTKDEIQAIGSRRQFGILNSGHPAQEEAMAARRGENFKYAPFAFTELGVAMLSSVLHSPTAIETKPQYNARVCRTAPSDTNGECLLPTTAARNKRGERLY